MFEPLVKAGCFAAGALLLSALATVQHLAVHGDLVWYGYIGPVLAGGSVAVLCRVWALQRRKTRERYANLELVLETLRTLNRLVVEVKDRDELLRKICVNLVENRRYFNAWIATFDASGRLCAVAETGLGGRFNNLAATIRQGWQPFCAARLQAQEEPLLVVDEPAVNCPDCPLADEYRGRAGLVARLEHQGTVYGMLCVSIPAGYAKDHAERRLFREIARDVGQALYHMELEGKRAQAVEATRRQMQELFAIFNAIEGAVYVADMTTYEILAVTASEEQFDADIIGKKCYEQFQRGQSGPCPLCTNDQLVGADGRPNPPVVWEFQNTRTDNWYLCIDRAIHWPDGRLVRMEIAINITERKRAEEAQRRSEKSLRELVDNSLVGIMLIQDGEIIYQNPEQRRMFGTLPRGYRVEDFEGVHPEDLPRLQESYRQVTQGEVAQVDVDFRYFPVRQRERSEGPMKWVYCRARPIDYQGHKTLLVSMMDMTHARELERLVQMQEKLSSLGRVAAGIAHEIRNPLSGVNIYLNTLEKTYDKPGNRDKVRDIFKQLYVASGKIESVIRRVMDFSKPSHPHFVVQDVNHAVENVLGLFLVTLRKGGILLEKELGAALPHCRIDAHLIEQVLMNLLANSAEAMKNIKGERRVRVSTERSGKYVLVRVADSGPGVPANARDKVFDPFYTTKSDGTGIGLSISHRIVTDHGGRLTVSESESGGAEFVVALPFEQESETL